MQFSHDKRRQPIILRIPGGVAIGLATVSITMMAFFRVSFLADIGEDLAMSVSRLGLFITLFGVGRLAADVPSGGLADRIHPRKLMAAAALIVAVGSLLLGAAPSSGWAFGAALLLGVGSSLTNTTSQVFFTVRTPIESRGMAMSLYMGSLMAGMAFGATLGGGIASISTWRTAELAAGLLLLCVSLFLLRLKSIESVVTDRTAPSPDRAAGRPPSTTIASRVVLYAIPFTTFSAAAVTIQTLIPIIGSQELGLSNGEIGVAIGGGGVMRVLATIVGGRLSDRVSRKSALVPPMMIGALGVTVLAFGSGYLAWFSAILLMAVAAHAAGAAATIIADLSPTALIGKNLGTFRFAGDVGLIVAPLLGAWAFDAIGREAAFVPLAVLLAVVGLAAAWLVPETRWAGSS